MTVSTIFKDRSFTMIGLVQAVQTICWSQQNKQGFVLGAHTSNWIIFDCNGKACFHTILTGCVLNDLWGILLRKTIEHQLPVYPQPISQQSSKRQRCWSLMELLRAQSIRKFKYHALGLQKPSLPIPKHPSTTFPLIISPKHNRTFPKQQTHLPSESPVSTSSTVQAQHRKESDSRYETKLITLWYDSQVWYSLHEYCLLSASCTSMLLILRIWWFDIRRV